MSDNALVVKLRSFCNLRGMIDLRGDIISTVDGRAATLQKIPIELKMPPVAGDFEFNLVTIAI